MDHSIADYKCDRFQQCGDVGTSLISHLTIGEPQQPQLELFREADNLESAEEVGPVEDGQTEVGQK